MNRESRMNWEDGRLFLAVARHGQMLAAARRLGTTQATLSVKASTLQAAETDQADYQTFATSVVSNLSDADVAAVASSLSTYQTQLKAAYSAIGTIRSLSLADYLK